jgi:TetR/AcrR family transcriptional regulator
MSATETFQRARDPEQKAQRRQELLGAARALLAADGLAGVGLSAIARAAGLAKSNVYRYFGSREEILMALLADDAFAWLAAFEREVAPLAGSNDAAQVAAILARTIGAHALTCQLIAVVAGVLEHNTSEAAAAEFKAQMLDLSIRIRNAIHAALPAIPIDRVIAFVRYLHALIAGLWPMAHPAPIMAPLLRHPEYASLASDFETDLRGCLRPLLEGLCRAGALVVPVTE